MQGNVNNGIEETKKGKMPEVGDYATEYLYSDSIVHEVLEVKDENHIRVRRLEAIRTDNNGISEYQEYRFEPIEDAEIIELKKLHGSWRKKIGDSWIKISLVVGVADYYYDYGF